MRNASYIVALIALISCGFSKGLLMKRPGGTDPIAVGIANHEPVDNEGDAASRFVELSHAVRDQELLSSGCSQKGCNFVQNCSGQRKTLKEKLEKKEKKLKKQVKEASKEYMQNHTKEELSVLKLQSELNGINAAMNGNNNSEFSELDGSERDEQ